MSIVRIGLAETKKFAEGYAAIFGNKKKEQEAEKPTEAEAEKRSAKREKPKKKAKK